jgi:ABC-type transport system involved in multi-copper enzyme maturation permease subunit
MRAALTYEWLRIRTIRSTWWLSVSTVVFGTGLALLISIGISEAFKSGNAPTARDLPTIAPGVVSQFGGFGAPFFLPYILAMLAVFAWGHEYRHGMIRATLTALPSRTNAWAAKFLVVGAWVAAVALVTMLLSMAVGWLFLHDDGVRFGTQPVWEMILRCLVYTVLFTWVGGAVTALIRHQAAALVLVFLWPLVIENVLQLVAGLVPGLQRLADLLRFLPFQAGIRIIRGEEFQGPMFGDPLSPLAGFIIFGAFALFVMALSLALFQSRDA